MEFITENLKIIIIAIIGLFATGIIITIKIRKKSKTNNSIVVKQHGNKVGGDMAGRDIKK